MKTLGERLKDLRKEKGYTLEQVAEKLNTTKITISRYENNLREPKRETISQLAKLFNVSTDYLHGHTNDKFTLTKEDKIDMCKEAIESLLTAMEVGLSLVKQKQKRDNNI